MFLLILRMSFSNMKVVCSLFVFFLFFQYRGLHVRLRCRQDQQMISNSDDESKIEL